jgi:uncharacterized iron-regulated protein
MKCAHVLALASAAVLAEAQLAPKWLLVQDAFGGEMSFEAFLESPSIQEAEVLFMGEFHDHVLGHFSQQLVLEAWDTLAPPASELAVSLEMFERDCQNSVDGYMAGDITEERFLAMSRPWPDYVRDYKPLVDYARDREQTVLAANIPRRYASFVANNRTADVFNMPDIELTFVAPEILAPDDDYKVLFGEAMGGHMPDHLLQQYYESQCIKDDTMAMSVADFMNGEETDRPRRVAQFTGTFHTGYKLGLFDKVDTLLPNRRKALVSVEKYDDTTFGPGNLPSVSAGPSGQALGDFVFFAPSGCPGQSVEACENQCSPAPAFDACAVACGLVCSEFALESETVVSQLMGEMDTAQ